MDRLRTIVVEDELLPRLSLLQKLEAFAAQIEIVDDCDNFDAALASILMHKPDLLFLDIQLQGRNAIQLMEEVRKSIPLPAVIFTTAYSDSQYLMSAIKLSAADYLLKPIDRKDLAIAIAKVWNARQSETPPKETAFPEKYVFRTVNGKIAFEPQDIAYIRADGNYAVVVTFKEEVVVLENLSSLQNRMDPSLFQRIDRSVIVNITKIYKINQRDYTCTFASSNTQDIQLKLSKAGVIFLSKMM